MGAGDVTRAVARLEAETTVSGLLAVACRELAAESGADDVLVSRAIGDLLVELAHHRGGGVGAPLELYLVSDYPLTQEAIERGEPRAASLDDPDVDAAEATLLERLGYRALLMLPLRSQGRSWGLVELYAAEREFEPGTADRLTALVDRLGARLAELER